MEEVSFLDSNKNTVVGTLLIPLGAKAVVILSHGFSSSKDSKFYVDLQAELNALGIGTFRYNYYGHGRFYCENKKYTVSEDLTLSKCVESLQAAIRFIGGKGDYNIGLLGSSFGGLISLVVASKDNNIKALALRSPVTEPIKFWQERLSEERMKDWKETGCMHYDELGEDFELNYAFWEDLSSYDTYKMAKKISCPTLIVHGKSDTVVSIKQSYDLANILGTKVQEIEGADHDYAELSQYDEMKGLIVNFLKETL